MSSKMLVDAKRQFMVPKDHTSDVAVSAFFTCTEVSNILTSNKPLVTFTYGGASENYEQEECAVDDDYHQIED
jgi:hypothetical protein